MFRFLSVTVKKQQCVCNFFFYYYLCVGLSVIRLIKVESIDLVFPKTFQKWLCQLCYYASGIVTFFFEKPPQHLALAHNTHSKLSCCGVWAACSWLWVFCFFWGTTSHSPLHFGAATWENVSLRRRQRLWSQRACMFAQSLQRWVMRLLPAEPRKGRETSILRSPV